MQNVTCSRCGKSVPMNDSLLHEGATYCVSCGEELQAQPDVSWTGVRRGVDPTICAWCGRDNGSAALHFDGVAPVCPDCHRRHLRPPLPPWVRLFLVVILAAVAGGILFNARFFRAWTVFRGANREAAAGRIEAAAAAMARAAALVPESADLADLAGAYQGVRLLGLNKPAEAAPLLQKWVRRHPDDEAMLELSLFAQLGAAFDGRDYGLMYQKAGEFRDRNPADNTHVLWRASAAACMYAQTGEERYREESEAIMAEVRARTPGADSGPDGEYLERILHRLESREIIDGEEYYRRFPERRRSPSP